MAQSIEDLRERRPRPAAGRVPPHNLEAEASLLGAMLLSRDAIAAAVEVVDADDFYKPAHGHVFDAISTLYAAGEPADPVTVAEELRRAGLLEAVGGPAALVSLQAGTPATSNAGRYARIVEEHALLRRLIGVAGEIAELGYGLPDDVAAAIDRAESMVFDVAQHRVTDSLVHIHDLMGRTLDRLETLLEHGDAITGVPTGYTDLDELLSGLQASNLVIVGARPATGKTSFALGMASHAAIEAGRPVLLCSLEMSHLEISQRLLCAEARVDSTRMRTGRLTESDWHKISGAMGRLGEAPIFIDDNPQMNVMEIRAKARRLKSRQGDLGLVIIDYLQLMTGRSSAENRQVEVSEISRGLKILARELECPVVALSQLSRALELRADKRPMLADLRESGCLTADTRILRADTGAEVTIGELCASGERDIPVWSLGPDLRLQRATMTHAFPSGTKETFRLRLASGVEVKASANHLFLTVDGWRRLDELSVDDRVGVPRQVPGGDETTAWSDDEVVLLAHLIGDGCFVRRQPLHYTTQDLENLEAVEKAATHFGVTGRRVQQENWWHLYLPAPEKLARGRRNPIAAWLDELGLFGLRSPEKFVPAAVFGLPRRQLALFLRHLWATDGSVAFDTERAGPPLGLYYSSTSRRLVDDVRQLLLRFGITTRLTITHKDGYEPGHQLWIYGADQQRRFFEEIGCHGVRGARAAEIVEYCQGVRSNPNVDTVPSEVWTYVKAAMAERGFTHRSFSEAMGWAYCGSARYRYSPTRPVVASMAEVLDDDHLRQMAASDLLWDRVVAIEPLGPQAVYDATVLGTHNFIADGVVVHNSLEQDADVVLFLYRDEIYNPDSPDRGTAEVLVAKHRSGPTGKVRLAFLDHYTRFANMARTPQ